jgi:HAD superfamily hydrolase (TIGR01456 family)
MSTPNGESTRRQKPRLRRAFVLDIDGCLSREGVPIAGSSEGLAKLRSLGVPFVFCTNGGGHLEADRAKKLSKTFGIDISPEQVIQSHTPLRTLVVPRLQDWRVLVVGENCGAVARSYGFAKAEGIREYGKRHHSLFPRSRDSDPITAIADDSDDPVRAVLFFDDPEDLGEALQIVLDVVLSNGNPSGPRVLQEAGATQAVEVWFTNPDKVYSSLARHPRLTQGSYRMCLETLFASATGGMRSLDARQLGKPSRETGECALAKLLSQFGETPADEVEIWTVGDNPLSDVALAKTMGWKSALVRTGIWDGRSPPEVEPTLRVDSFAALLEMLMSEDEEENAETEKEEDGHKG